MSGEGDAAQRLAQQPVIAALPVGDGATVARLAEVVVDAGCVALTVPWAGGKADALLVAVRDAVGDRAIVGVTAIPGLAEAWRALDRGARLIITTALRPAVVPACHSVGALCALSALTPTEALGATEAAADYVRVWPVDLAGGPAYLAALRSHMPWVAWLASGEIPVENLAAYRAAGATLFELSSTLLPPLLCEPSQEDALRAHVKRVLATAAALPAVADARD